MVSFSLEAPLYLSWDDRILSTIVVHFLRTWGSWSISQASEVNTRTRSTRLSIVRREDVWGRFWLSPSHRVFGRPWYSSMADSENHRSALNLSDDRHFSGEQWGPTFNMPFTRGWQMDVTLLPRITEGSCFTEPFWEEHRLFFGTGEAPLLSFIHLQWPAMFSWKRRTKMNGITEDYSVTPHTS